MEQEYKNVELESFYNVVDKVIDDLENGRINGEDAKPKHKPKTMEDTIIKGTSTEYGEGDDIDSLEVIGKSGKRLVVVTPEDGSAPTVYGSPSVAARAIGLTPTTIKNRCDHNKVDAKGNTWSYKDAE